MPAKEESSDMSSNHEELDLEMLRKNFRMIKLDSRLYFL